MMQFDSVTKCDRWELVQKMMIKSILLYPPDIHDKA